MDENENVLIFELTGNQSDLDFVRERVNGAIIDILEEYESNLDEEVGVDWRWKR